MAYFVANKSFEEIIQHEAHPPAAGRERRQGLLRPTVERERAILLDMRAEAREVFLVADFDNHLQPYFTSTEIVQFLLHLFRNWCECLLFT